MKHKALIKFVGKQFNESEIQSFARKIEEKLPFQYWQHGILVNLNTVVFQLTQISVDLDQQLRVAEFTQMNDRALVS